MRNIVFPFSLFICSLLLQHASAASYMLLTSTDVKCLRIDPLVNQEITIKYDCPDLMTMDENGGQSSSEERNEAHYDRKDDISSQNAAQYKRRMEEAEKKGHALNDIKFTMAQRFDQNENVKKWRRNRNRNKQEEKQLGTVYHSEIMTKQRGEITFRTSPVDPGLVEICLQSDSAGTGEQAMRFMLDISIQDYVDPDERKKEVGTHLSKMEAEVKALQSKVKYLLNRGFQDQQAEVEFHDKTISMNKAMRFWPMFHVFVLIVVSAFQVNHILQFFKKKNMYL